MIDRAPETPVRRHHLMLPQLWEDKIHYLVSTQYFPRLFYRADASSSKISNRKIRKEQNFNGETYQVALHILAKDLCLETESQSSSKRDTT